MLVTPHPAGGDLARPLAVSPDDDVDSHLVAFEHASRNTPHGRPGFYGRSHFDECKTTRPAGLTMLDDPHGTADTYCSEKIEKLCFGYVQRQIAHVKARAHDAPMRASDGG
jgi:hypothetical protein